MSDQASPEQIRGMVGAVDEFYLNYARLSEPKTRDLVYRTRDQEVISNYETALNRAQTLDANIRRGVGVWNTVRDGYVALTDQTSMVIGDWIDEVRSWFGYDPAPGIGNYVSSRGASPISGGTLGALSGIQLPAAAITAAFVVGIASVAIVLNNLMNKIFIRIEAARLQRENPGMTPAQALSVAGEAYQSDGLFGNVNLPLIAAGALAAFWFLNRKRRG